MSKVIVKQELIMILMMKIWGYSSKCTIDTYGKMELNTPTLMIKRLGFFVKRYQSYIRKNGVKHSDKNLTKFGRVAKASREDENKKGKLRSLCYNYGEFGHYRLEFPKIKKKKKEKGHHNKSSKSRRAYGTWESASDSSSDESSTSSVESTWICLKENRKKKKNVSLYKLETINYLSYLKLQKAFEYLHRKALKAFKKLASHEKFFLHLEDKMLEFKRKLEAIKRSTIDIQSDNNEDEKPSKFGCESYHDWKKEINALQVKLDKVLQPKIAFTIDPSKYEGSLNHVYLHKIFLKKQKKAIDHPKAVEHEKEEDNNCEKGKGLMSIKENRDQKKDKRSENDILEKSPVGGKVDNDDIVNEEEELFDKMFKKVISRDVEMKEVELKEAELREIEFKEAKLKEADDVQMAGDVNVGVENHYDVHMGGEVHDDDDSDEYAGFKENEIDNVIAYEQDEEGTIKKHK
ncbi:uncharacterized protein LOC127094660 [Lathyrus oleraceus]|uniref:uncharacterized protein LOC127094660 n=1 Tax=Pisum sativum TaxID=3888 RepID=UPI0021D064B0|nr:uncharacterized protein LOC127094660 [Pisum sativum]